VPIYALMRLVPSTRESARRLGLVTLAQMVAALTEAVEHPPEGVRVLSVPNIWHAGRAIQQHSASYSRRAALEGRSLPVDRGFNY